jgi:hypothetical protein
MADDRAASPPPPPVAPAPGTSIHQHLAVRVFERYGAFGLLFLMAGYVLTRIGSAEMPLVFQALDRYGPWAGGLVIAAWHLANVRQDNATFLRQVAEGVLRIEEAQERNARLLGELFALLRGPAPVKVEPDAAPPSQRPSRPGRAAGGPKGDRVSRAPKAPAAPT